MDSSTTVSKHRYLHIVVSSNYIRIDARTKRTVPILTPHADLPWKGRSVVVFGFDVRILKSYGYSILLAKLRSMLLINRAIFLY